jgi:hypothetical protein
MKHVFVNSARRLHTWLMIFISIILVMIGFFFTGDGAMKSRIVIWFLGLTQFIWVLPDLLSLRQRKTIWVIRSLSILCLIISFTSLILLLFE